MILQPGKWLFVALLCCGFSLPALAGSEIVEIYFLPLQEAADAARSQLSDDGKVAAMPSQHILIIDDDKAHIKKATALLKRLDHQPGQYTAYVNIEHVRSTAYGGSSASGALSQGRLSGGWARLQLRRQTQHVGSRQAFELRISANQAGSIETGTLTSLNRETRIWLSGYGIVRADSVERTPITSGFNILIRPAGRDQVRVRMMPWMKRATPHIQGQHELLIDLGSTKSPATPPSNSANMRLNARPVLQQNPAIEIVGAATELVIPIDQSVTIAASNQEAEKLGDALLSRFSSTGKRRFIIHLRVSKR